MSVKVMGIVWEADLPQREKFVLLAYADHADHEGYNIYPSVGLIAWKTGYSERSIQRITKDLLKSGILIDDGTSQYSTNRYKIDIDAIPRLSQYKGGVRVSPLKYGGDILSGVGGDNLSGGDTGVTGGVTKTALRGDTAMSPDPSLTVIKPSLIDKEEETPRPNIFVLYEQNFGSITAMMRDILIDAEQEYSDEWIREAFRIAVTNNARKWSYVETILHDWQVNGYKNDKKRNGKQSKTKEKSYAERRLEELTHGK